MRWYRTGTANVTLNSTNVTGNGVDWLAGARVGEGFMGPDGRVYEISTIVSATQLTLGTPYLGATASAAAYQIVPTQSFIRDLAAQAAQLVTDFTTVAVNHVSVVGNQTIGGVKTFTSPIVGSTNTQVSLTGDQTIGGIKTFTSNLGIGTSSPQANLEVSAPLGSNGPTLRLSSTGASATPGQQIGALDFFNSDTDIPGVAAYVRALAGPSFGVGGQLIFGTQETWNTGVLRERLRIDSAGNVLVTSNTGGLGYGTGAGGTVTQATSKSTAVTLNRPSGQITMNNEALAGGASVSFTLNNTLLSTSDTVVVNMGFGSGGNYSVEAVFVYGGGCTIRVTNLTGGSLSDTPQIQFAIIKGATS